MVLHENLPYLFDVVAQGKSFPFGVTFIPISVGQVAVFVLVAFLPSCDHFWEKYSQFWCLRMLAAAAYTVGLAVAVIAYASQSAQLTHRDSPLAVILFATTSILLFTLPRIGGDSRIPHVVVLLFGFTTILGYLFGTFLTH